LPLIFEEANGADALTIQYVMSYHGRMRNLDPVFPWFIFSKYQDLPFPEAYLDGQPPDYEAIRRTGLTWDKAQRLQYLGGIPYRGQMQNKQTSSNTLEAQIDQILEALAAVKPKWNNPEWFTSPDLEMWIVDFALVLNSSPVYPTVGARFQAFSQSNDPKLIATVLLSQSDMMTLGILLGLHKKYWPIYTKNWPRDGIPHDQAYAYKQDMHSEIITTVHNYCD
jgi:hypothetical protein